MNGNCNITKDLLPLYMEELCSEDSREYVERHLKQCEECNRTYEYLKYTDLCISATEKQEISAFKKLERYISGKILFNYFLFLVAIVIGTVILLFTTNRASYTMYFLLMPLTMLATGFTFMHAPFEKQEVKRWNMLLVPQTIILLCSMGVMFYVFYALSVDVSPFGIPTYRLGPIMSTMFKGNICISMITMITYLYQVGRKKVRYSSWMNIAILSIFLNLSYDASLYRMDSFETTWNRLIQNTVLFFVIGIGTTFAMWIVAKIRRRKGK